MLLLTFFFSQFSLADSLYSYGYHDAAKVEYKREFFFYPELKNNQNKRLKFAISTMKRNKSKGIEEFGKIINDFPVLKPVIKISMAKHYMSIGEYHPACELLMRTDQQKLLGYCYILDEKYFRARDHFIAISNNKIAEEINVYLNASKKSIRTATILSLVCPGAGEIYAGNIELGIKDFLLNLGSGFLLYNAWQKEKYVDAVLIFSLLFQRFYIGSLFNAQKSVEETNRRKTQEWLNKLRQEHFNDIDLDLRNSN